MAQSAFILVTVLAVLAWTCSADVDHTVAYLDYGNHTDAFYTSVYYDGIFNSSGAVDTVTIRYVGTPTHPDRTGNSQTCATSETCTATTPTTITITAIPSDTTTYTLTSLGFTIPWQYFLSRTIPAMFPTGDKCGNNEQLGTGQTPPITVPANEGLFGSVGSFCMSQETYNLSTGPYSDHPGPPFPPVTYDLGDMADNAVSQLACSINSCPRTSQKISGVSSTDVAWICECGVSALGQTYYYYLQTINPFTGSPPAVNNIGVCNVYAINQPAPVDSVAVQVSSSLGNETINYRVSDGEIIYIPVGDDVWQLAVTGTGTSGNTVSSANPYAIESGALLIECTPYGGGRSNVSLPVLCDDANDHANDNYVFYVPAHYASHYDNNVGYGAPLDNIYGQLDANTPDQCSSYEYVSQRVPGYPLSSGTGVLYDGTFGPCSGQSTTNPIFDASRLCYNSVSPSTMYDAQARGLDQWHLPGTFGSDTVQYETVWDDAESGGVLTQTIPSTALHPVPAHTYQYSLRIDIATTLMAYISDDQIPSATVLRQNTTCGYTFGDDATGQYKVTVCNSGTGNNAQTFVNYQVVSYCEDGLYIPTNGTQVTYPLAQGDCQGIVYSLFVNASAFVPTPTAGPNDTDPGAQAIPPSCHSSILTTPTPVGLPAVLEDINCVGLPAPDASHFGYIIIGVVFGIVMLLVVIFLVWCKFRGDIKDPAKPKKTKSE